MAAIALSGCGVNGVPNLSDRAKASSLDSACRQLYSHVSEGKIDSASSAEALGNMKASKLPSPSDTKEQKLAAAKSLTVKDAMDYAFPTDYIAEKDMGNFVADAEGNVIYVEDEQSAADYITLTYHTPLGELYKE